MKLVADIVRKEQHSLAFKTCPPDTHPHMYTCRTRGPMCFVLSSCDYELGKIELTVEPLPARGPFTYYRDLASIAPALPKPSILNGLAGDDHFEGTTNGIQWAPLDVDPKAGKAPKDMKAPVAGQWVLFKGFVPFSELAPKDDAPDRASLSTAHSKALTYLPKKYFGL